MSYDSIALEAQDYLLRRGDPDAMVDVFPDVLRSLGRAMPIWAEITAVPDAWYAGAWTDASMTYTDTTAAAQSLSGCVLTTLTNGDGALIGAGALFPQVTLTVVQVAVGGTLVTEWTYWNGVAWWPLPLQQAPDFTMAGTQTLLYALPDDWTQGIPTGVTFPVSFDANQFWIRLRATTAPSTIAPVASLAVQRQIFPLPDEALQLLNIHYMPSELAPILVGEALDLLDPSWRTRQGQPSRYTQDITSTIRVRLTPLPQAVAATGIPPFSGLPGAVATAGYVVMFLLETPRADALPDWLEGVVALGLAAREAMREGETQDLVLAGALKQVLGMVLGILQSLYKEQGLELDTPWSSQRIAEVLQ
jgi:hypothetical protein